MHIYRYSKYSTATTRTRRVRWTGEMFNFLWQIPSRTEPRSQIIFIDRLIGVFFGGLAWKCRFNARVWHNHNIESMQLCNHASSPATHSLKKLYCCGRTPGVRWCLEDCIPTPYFLMRTSVYCLGAFLESQLSLVILLFDYWGITPRTAFSIIGPHAVLINGCVKSLPSLNCTFPNKKHCHKTSRSDFSTVSKVTKATSVT